MKKGYEGSIIEAEFTVYEMKRALSGVNRNSPGKDKICVEIIKNVSF